MTKADGKEAKPLQSAIKGVIFLGLLILTFAGRKDSPTGTPAPPPPSAPIGYDEARGMLSECVRPLAFSGPYSSRDGESAVLLLRACIGKTSLFSSVCVKSGRSEKSCEIEAILLAQNMLVNFQK